MFGYVWSRKCAACCMVVELLAYRWVKENEKNIFFLIILITILLCSIKVYLQSTSQGHGQSPILDG